MQTFTRNSSKRSPKRNRSSAESARRRHKREHVYGDKMVLTRKLAGNGLQFTLCACFRHACIVNNTPYIILDQLEMGPQQVFPYDDWGGRRTPLQLSGDATQVHDGGGDARIANKPATSATFSPEEEEADPLTFSDLDDGLDDDDDDDAVALESNWPRRDQVSKRGVEIFVGGLTRSTRRDMLRDWFQHAGEVTEVRIARDKRRRRCRGYGYVRFATSGEANRAIEMMHRFEFKPGRFLGVLPSDENRTLFVGGLKEEWSCEYICKLLQDKMPGLRKVEPIPDREDRLKIRTFCFLEFATHAEAAVVFNRHQVETLSSRLQTPYSAGGDADAMSSAGSSSAAFERETRASTGSVLDGMLGDMGSSSVGDRERCPSTPLTSDFVYGEGTPSSPLDFQALPDDLASVRGDENGWGQHKDDDPGGNDGELSNAIPDAGASGGVEHEEGGDGKSFALRGGKTPAAATPPTGGAVGSPRGVPLIVGGAVLKVDWADPLRYHIHLNGGIKGPCSPPELALPESRPSARVSGRVGTSSVGGVGGGAAVGVHSRPEWYRSQGLVVPPPKPQFSSHWQEEDYLRSIRTNRSQHPRTQQSQQCLESAPLHRAYGGPSSSSSGNLMRRDRVQMVMDPRAGNPPNRRASCFGFEGSLGSSSRQEGGRIRAASFAGTSHHSAYPPVHRNKMPGQEFVEHAPSPGPELHAPSTQDRFSSGSRLVERSLSDHVERTTWRLSRAPAQGGASGGQRRLGNFRYPPGNGSGVSGGAFDNSGGGVYPLGQGCDERAWSSVSGTRCEDVPRRGWGDGDAIEAARAPFVGCEASWPRHGPENDIPAPRMTRTGSGWSDRAGSIEAVLTRASTGSPPGGRAYETRHGRVEVMEFPGPHGHGSRKQGSVPERQQGSADDRGWPRPGVPVRQTSEPEIIHGKNRRFPGHAWSPQAPSSPVGLSRFEQAFDATSVSSATQQGSPSAASSSSASLAVGGRCHSASPLLGAPEVNGAHSGDSHANAPLGFSMQNFSGVVCPTGGVSSSSAHMEAMGTCGIMNGDRRWLHAGGSSWQVGSSPDAPGSRAGEDNAWGSLSAEHAGRGVDEARQASGVCDGSDAAFGSNMAVRSAIWEPITSGGMEGEDRSCWPGSLFPSGDGPEGWVS